MIVKMVLAGFLSVVPLFSVFPVCCKISDYMCYTYKAVSYEEIKEEERKACQKDFEEKRTAYIEEKNKKKQVAVNKSYYQSTDNDVTYNMPSGGLTKSGGVNYYGDQKETYYNLNMNGVVNNAQNAGVEGDYWVRDDGVKMYGEYVIVAANQEVHPYGSTVETSLGTGIVLDTGGFAAGNPTQVDIATDW